MTAPMTWPPRSWGEQPQRVPVKLTRGADLIWQLEPPAGSQFAAGAAMKMVIFANDTPRAAIIATWEAVVSPAMAEIVVQSDVADAIPDGAYGRFYYAGTDTPRDDYCLTAGPVQRY